MRGDLGESSNLQLEGLYVAVAALMNALRNKGVLSAHELDQALSAAENRIESDPALTWAAVREMAKAS